MRRILGDFSRIIGNLHRMARPERRAKGVADGECGYDPPSHNVRETCGRSLWLGRETSHNEMETGQNEAHLRRFFEDY
jgi:hypothetical protein